MTTTELKSYIYKVLKQVHPDNGITSEAKQSVNNLLNLVLNKLVWIASDRVRLRKKKTLQYEDLEFAAAFLMEGSLKTHAASESTKAVVKWNAATERKQPPTGTRNDSSVMAGLTFPPTRIENTIRDITPIDRVSKMTGISAAAILEYLTAEILELAGNAARDEKKVQISAAHIDSAVSQDKEISALFDGVLLPGGFVKYQEKKEESDAV